MEHATGAARGGRGIPWLLIAVFLFLAAGIAGSARLYYDSQVDRETAMQTNALRAIAELKVGEIRHWLNERLGDANTITQNPLLSDELQPMLAAAPSMKRFADVRRWLNALQRHLQYSNILLLDMNGRVVQASLPWDAKVGPEGLALIQRARRSWKAEVSDLHSNPAVRHIHLDLAAPLIAEDRVIGFVLLRIEPATFLYPMIQSWPTPSTSAETLLVRREGDDVLFLNELRHRRGTAMRLRLPIRRTDLPAARAVQGHSGFVAGRDYRGIPVWAVTQPVPGTSWSIVAKIDREEVMAPMRLRARVVLVAALALILAAAALTLLLWRQAEARQRAALERTGRDLGAALDQVERLQGLLPTCAACKRIRDKQGDWQPIEAYISARSEAEFSHGICPECAEKLYGHSLPGRPPGASEEGPGKTAAGSAAGKGAGEGGRDRTR
jgi:type II secretory pathway pseudopilin PulG